MSRRGQLPISCIFESKWCFLVLVCICCCFPDEQNMQVDWIVQVDPPDDPREYIHRVGRTARGAGGKGKALLFLMPEEVGFLRYLKQAGVPLNEYTFPSSKLANVQTQLERLIEKNYYLHKSSRDAYRSYLHVSKGTSSSLLILIKSNCIIALLHIKQLQLF